MAQQVTGAKQLIIDRGGYRAVAKALNWPVTTVHTFCRSDRAPKYRWDAIEALLPVEQGAVGHPDREEGAAPTASAAEPENTVNS